MEKKLSFEDLIESSIKPIIEDWIIENQDWVFGEAEKPKKKRSNSADIDYSITPWGRMLVDPRLADENSRQAKKFKLRFRTPHSMFVVVFWFAMQTSFLMKMICVLEYPCKLNCFVACAFWEGEIVPTTLVSCLVSVKIFSINLYSALWLIILMIIFQ